MGQEETSGSEGEEMFPIRSHSTHPKGLLVSGEEHVHSRRGSFSLQEDGSIVARRERPRTRSQWSNSQCLTKEMSTIIREIRKCLPSLKSKKGEELSCGGREPSPFRGDMEKVRDERGKITFLEKKFTHSKGKNPQRKGKYPLYEKILLGGWARPGP